MGSGVITLTTDWNGNINFMGVIKSYWLENNVAVPLVEITHQIPVFNSMFACYTVKSVYRGFPKNSVHVIGVSNQWIPVEKSKPLLGFYNGHWFIGYESQAFYTLFDGESTESPTLWELPFKNSTFPEFDLLIKPAVEIVSGKSGDEVGELLKNKLIPTSKPVCVGDIMTVDIQFIDVYGNVVTNCSRKQFYDFVGDRPFEIMVLRPRNKIRKISEGYNQEMGTMFAMFNSLGYLELGIINYRLDLSVGVRLDSKIKITRL